MQFVCFGTVIHSAHVSDTALYIISLFLFVSLSSSITVSAL